MTLLCLQKLQLLNSRLCGVRVTFGFLGLGLGDFFNLLKYVLKQRLDLRCGYSTIYAGFTDAKERFSRKQHYIISSG